MGVNRLLLIEFIYSCYKFTEYTYIYEVVGIFILLFYLYELRLLQDFSANEGSEEVFASFRASVASIVEKRVRSEEEFLERLKRFDPSPLC